MAEINTDSYPKAAALPTQKSALDQAQQYGTLQQQQQAIQSNALTIDKQKLDLVNQRFGEMAKGFAGLIAKPDLNMDDIRRYTNTQVKLGYVPADMAATTLSNLPNTTGMQPAEASKVLKGALEQHLAHAQTMVEAINTQFGQNQDIDTGNQTITGVRASPLHGGTFNPANTINRQLPPTTPINNAEGAPGIVGPAGPPGIQPAAPMPLPARRPAGLPVAAPAISGATGPTVNNGTEFNNRFSAAFPNAIQTGPAPGVAEANLNVGSEGGKDYAAALKQANNYAQDIYPMQRVLDIVHEEGAKAFGPGTESLNNLKSALVTWLPGVDQKTIDGVSNFEQAKKYLVQAARTAGNTGTNDQLAAAFEANPNVKMSGATIENVIKSNIALRRMQNAQTLLFGQQKDNAGQPLQPSQYSKWVSKNQNVLDPRAFGFDLMDGNAQKKLLDSFTEKESDSKEMKAAKAQAYTKFRKSLQFAHEANLIGQ